MQGIWLSVGNENMSFFQNYEKGRKNINTIWGMQTEEGGTEKYFKELYSLGCNHFKSFFKAPTEPSIAEWIRVDQLFPRYIEEEGNDSTMDLVSKEEVERILKAMQKEKISSPDGWTV